MAGWRGRHGDGAGPERKIRAARPPWTVGDIVMVADGQWAVGLTAPVTRRARGSGCRTVPAQRPLF